MLGTLVAGCGTPYFGDGRSPSDDPGADQVMQAEPAATDGAPAIEAPAIETLAPGPAAADLEPLVLPIAGTSVTLEMLPVDAPDGAVFVATTEATWDLYDAFIFNLDTDAGESTPESDAVTRPSKPYVLADRGYGHANYAVLSVSPNAAKQFVEWLSIKTGRTFRVPTLVEMEHLLRTSGVEDADARLAHGWFEENAEYTTHEVGTRPADANGLFDLWGNVSEYATTPEGDFVVVGGSFIDPVAGVDLDYRIPFTPDWNADDPQIPKSPWWLASNDWVGVRLVCEP